MDVINVRMRIQHRIDPVIPAHAFDAAAGAVHAQNEICAIARGARVAPAAGVHVVLGTAGAAPAP